MSFIGGTEPYNEPLEENDNKGNLKRNSYKRDLFSLGVILYNVMQNFEKGQRAYDEESKLQIIQVEEDLK